MTCSSLSCKLYQGDCFEWLKALPDASVDFVCTDMPYGVTKAHWDCKINLGALWGELKRIAKPNAAFAMFGSGKFAYQLVMSNFADFRYRYTWEKNGSVNGFLNSHKRPLTRCEDILLFYKKQPTYNPQRREPEGGGRPYIALGPHGTALYMATTPRAPTINTDGLRYPTDLLKFNIVPNNERGHTTEKPVSLLEFLIRTYTNEGELVLDPFMGSGSCGIACMNTGRTFVGMEKDPKFFSIAAERLQGDCPPEYSFELFKS